MTQADPLSGFGPATSAWFRSAFDGPTAAQAEAWGSIAQGSDTLVIAPTGSGKTLAAFLWALDRLAADPVPDRCSVLYVSPLRALATDIERNLRAPLAGMRAAAADLGLPEPQITVGVRTSDTPASQRQRMLRHPPNILITTPESLFLMLTSQAEQVLADVGTVIIDEIHSFAGSKRGSHLGLSLLRLDQLTGSRAQRIGLSATVTPAAVVAGFLNPAGDVAVIDPDMPAERSMQLQVPVPDMTNPGTDDEQDTPTIWPAVQRDVLDLIRTHTTTIVFANSRRVSERLCAQLNDLASGSDGEGPPEVPAELVGAAGIAGGAEQVVARAHHGSVSKSERAHIEDLLKRGELPAVVATSSLELGIDMGSIDLMVQIGCPPSVASGLQRLGRAGHQLGAVSSGVFIPTHRGDLLATAVTLQQMGADAIEPIGLVRHPLDVLSQQIVAMVSMRDWTVPELFSLVRRAPGYSELPESAYRAVLDMLAGRYPSTDLAAFRPVLVWDRSTDVLSARPGAQRAAITSGGTIPDRGLFPVFLVGTERGRVGELDEEMVYESRVGDLISLGASTWRIEEITHDRVLVTPAPGRPGRLPFWHGDAMGRSFTLSRAIGGFLRQAEPEARRGGKPDVPGANLWAVDNLGEYLSEQVSHTGALPTDRRILVERFRDEVGDWRVVVHAFVGQRVTAAWGLLIDDRLRERFGLDAQIMASDEGLVLRLPDTESPDWWADLAEVLTPGTDELAERLGRLVTGTALFAARFRECASRALLLRRRMPGKRTPLWQQRQRSAQLLSAAAGFSDFPIVLETVRECLEDVYDVEGLREVLDDIAAGRCALEHVETLSASPMARTQLFSYVATFLYEADNPLTASSALALELDLGMLSELLGGQSDQLLPSEAIAEVEARLQWRNPPGRLRSPEDLADLLRQIGPHTPTELDGLGCQPGWAAELEGQRRAVRVRLGGREVLAAVEDVAALRDALGVVPPASVAASWLEPVADAMPGLLTRYARTHGPFTTEQAAEYFGLGVQPVQQQLDLLLAQGRLRAGVFDPRDPAPRWVEVGVLAAIRRRAAAQLRGAIDAVPAAAMAAFLPSWQSADPGQRRRGPDAVLDTVAQLAGYAAPADAWESALLPARIEEFSGRDLDGFMAGGEIQWCGTRPMAGVSGHVVMVPADAAYLLPAEDLEDLPEAAGRLLSILDSGGGWFFRDLCDRLGSQADQEVEAAIWELVWRGAITNDTLEPLRRLRAPSRARSGRRVMPRRSGPPAMSGRWSRLRRPEVHRTEASLAWAQTLLSRYGIVTRDSLAAERVPGGFHGLFQVFRHLEEAGRCHQVYAVEGQGAAQFSLPTAVDRLQVAARAEPRLLLLAATDPANAYGAGLPWPDPPSGAGRPARRAGAYILLRGGELVAFIEKGLRSLTLWPDPDPGIASALVEELRRAGAAARVTNINGFPHTDSPWREPLRAAGLVATPGGLRLRL